MKVLLAVDGSAYTKRMLAYLAAHEELLGARCEFTALTVVPKVPAYASRHVPLANIELHYQDEAEEVLKPVREYAAQKGWRVTTRFEPGQPAEVIASAATTGHFDLIVIGSHGQSALGNLVMGSVATGVLAQCKVPVLLIR